MTVDLIAQLRAAIDEDEQFATWAAEQVGDGRWEQRGARIVTAADRGREVADYAIVECIDHIVRHDPARVLLQVAAHRKVLELHEGAHECSVYDHNGDIDNCAWVTDVEHCSTVSALAEAYGIEP